MLILLSPAKTQQFAVSRYPSVTVSPFIEESSSIIKALKSLTVRAIETVMKVKEPLARSTYESIHKWNGEGIDVDQVDALSGFSGPAFKALDPQTLSNEAAERAKSQLIILSGLYGVLHAENRFMPYRLEMGLSFKPDGKTSLTKYWQPKISSYISSYCKNEGINFIINLASTEYSKTVVINDPALSFITVDFKEMREGKLKSISSYAKHARGLMARYILENGVKSPDELRKFDLEGYAFSSENSSETLLTFIRES